jgi:hypothetical protein
MKSILRPLHRFAIRSFQYARYVDEFLRFQRLSNARD